MTPTTFDISSRLHLLVPAGLRGEAADSREAPQPGGLFTITGSCFTAVGRSNSGTCTSGWLIHAQISNTDRNNRSAFQAIEVAATRKRRRRTLGPVHLPLRWSQITVYSRWKAFVMRRSRPARCRRGRSVRVADSVDRHTI